MAWMKIDLELPEKPEVHVIAGIISKDPEFVVGALIKVWGWFDKHTTDGNAFGVTYSLVDRITNVTGFGEAMSFVGWLEQKDKYLIMPKFDRHTSESAKQRALTSKRVAENRAKSTEKCNDDSVTSALPREDKIREDNIYTQQKTRKPRKTPRTPLPENFAVSEQVRSWAEKNGHKHLDEHFEYFVSTAKAKGYEYADWDSAFMNAVRGNWAKLNGTPKDDWRSEIK